MYAGIFVYTIAWIISALIVGYAYRNYKRRYAGYREFEDDYANKKINFIGILLVSVIFTLFNSYATTSSVVVGGDRQNYILNFQGVRATSSFGLQIVMNIVHAVGGDMNMLYYVTTFISVVITMCAYKLSKKSTPYVFVLLCLTQYFLATLTALKQSYASALAVLVFVILTDYESKKMNIVAIISIILACLFHPTGFVLIPIYLVVKAEKTRKNIILYFLALIIVGVFFEPFMLLLARLVQPIFGSLSVKLLEYFGDTATQGQDSLSISVIKGLPYYLITLLGLTRRRFLKDKINNYDSYLVIIGTGAFIYLVSIYSGWLSRFVYFFSFTSFVFFNEIMKKEYYRTNRYIYNGVVMGSLAVVTYRFLFLVYSLYGGF